MDKVQIFITHYITKDLIDMNDILVEEIQYLEYITKYPHEITIVYYDDGKGINELYDRLPKEVKIVKNDRPGRSDIQPSLRNKVIDLAKDEKYFVLLHNDIRVTVGWLDNLVNEMRYSEEKYGKGNCVITPRYVPYHYIGSNSERSENNNFRAKYPDFWNWLRTCVNCLSIDAMSKWCNKQGFRFDGVNIYSPDTKDCHVTDDGHQLMMFMGTKKFFQDIGPCDETFLGWGYDDQDWGIRALLSGKKNLKSQTCLIGHIEGLTFYNKNFPGEKRSHNADIFIKKWGRAIFDEMQTGNLWIRLHNEQKQKGL